MRWYPPPDFTLVDLDASSREEWLSPVGSEAEARRVRALRTDGLYAEPRIDDLRSRLVAVHERVREFSRGRCPGG